MLVSVVQADDEIVVVNIDVHLLNSIPRIDIITTLYKFYHDGVLLTSGLRIILRRSLDGWRVHWVERRVQRAVLFFSLRVACCVADVEADDYAEKCSASGCDDCW